MSLLFESIKVANNKLCNVEYHNQRLNRTRLDLLGEKNPWNIDELISIPENLDPGKVYKCRILYTENIKSVEFLPYSIRKIETFGVVIDNQINYSYKHLERESLEKLIKLSPLTDDIIIVKNNLVTDSSHANLIFFDVEKWITPVNPLLYGTKRQKYIDEKRIVPKKIFITDIKNFTKIKIINAMIDIEESPEVSIENVFNLP